MTSTDDEMAVRTLVHEYGNDWDLTIEQEKDLEDRILAFLKTVAPK